MATASREGYELSDEPARLDLDRIHAFLSRETYWCANIPRATVEKAVANSLCFGLYHSGSQVGFAREYEQVYEKPERQRELAWLRERIPEILRRRIVLEVACGTGYWTQHIAKRARKVHACDINDAVLEIAREKAVPPGRVDFFKADAVSLEHVPRGCDGAFAGFWWSHVKKSELALFVKNLSLKLEPGAVVAILDNTFTEWSSTPLSRRDAEGNTYQKRKLANGEEFEIMKNFPTKEELAELVRPVAAEAHMEELTYYWLLVFTLK